LGKLFDLVSEVLGVGRPYLAECDFGDLMAFCHTGEGRGCSVDYLVIRLRTGDSAEDYKHSSVAVSDLVSRVGKVCELLRRLRELERRLGRVVLYAAFLTRNPYLSSFALGPSMTPGDVVAAYFAEPGDGCARAIREYLLEVLGSDLADVEAPYFTGARGRFEPLCS